MEKGKSIRIVDIQPREIDPFTTGNSSDSDDERYSRGEPTYMVQLFGIDEKRNTYSVFVEGFSPYFYIKVDATRGGFKVAMFEEWLTKKLGDKYADGIEDVTMEKHKKLYGFDAGTQHCFIKLSFSNMDAYHKTKNLWYNIVTKPAYKKSLKKYHRNKKKIYGNFYTRIRYSN